MPPEQQQQAGTTIAQQAVSTSTPAAVPAAAAPAPAAAESGAAPETALPVNTSFAEDDAELAKLEAEQARLAQEAGAAAAGATQGTPAGSAVAAPAGAQAAGAPAAQAVPQGDAIQQAQAASNGATTGAIIGMRKQLGEERAARLRAEGAAAALEVVARTAVSGQAAGQAAPAAEPAAPTFDEQRAQIDTDIVALATEFEEGRLTATEWKRKEVALNRQREELVVQQAAEVAQSAPTQQHGNDLGLEQHLIRLVQAFPVLTRLNETDLKPFYELAYRQAALRNEIIPDTAQGTVILRERMAALAEEFYDAPAAARRKAAQQQAAGGVAPSAGSGQAGGAAAAGARPTAGQREAKLQLAAAAPPDISTLGSGAQAGELTEANVEARFKGMNEDQQIKFLEANPGFVSKVMGGKTQRA